MERMGTRPDPYVLFNRFAPRIEALSPCRPPTRQDLLVPEFQLIREGKIHIYYAPFDYTNSTARVAIIGITPGFTEMATACLAARAALVAGLAPEEVCRRAKHRASFAGPTRRVLLQMLDGVGLPAALGIASSAGLFGQHCDLLHTTAIIRYPVFVDGRNYSGHSPTLLRSPLLRTYVHGLLSEELRSLRRALLIPLGLSASAALQQVIGTLGLKPEQCLFGFPHPSGANGHRARQYARMRHTLAAHVKSWLAHGH